jgi:hypothetical protein
MDVAVWTYPWDLHDIGIAEAEARLRNAGANMISLAASYHAGRFLQPGNPKRRIYFPQDGTIYYRPNPAHWQGAEIKPLMADIVETEGDMLTDMIRRRDAGGPGVSAWTVCLHNSRLGIAHPGHVTRTAHGDPNFYALCPSSPAVQDYVTRLVGEIASFAPNRIEIESPDFMGFAHGYHHEKDGLPTLPEDQFLLGLCFCRHCTSAARTAAVPVDEARHVVQSLLDAAFARELPAAQFPTLDFSTLPALQAFLTWRSTPITALIARLRSVVPATTELLLIDAEGTSDGGVNLPDLIPHLDGILHCAYHTPLARIAPLMAETRSLLGPRKTLITGFQLFHPAARSREDLAARVGAAGADGFNFYCLGLVPPARLDWIRTAMISA